MEMNKEIVYVNIEDIIPNRFQPRLSFDENALNELASSIKQHGIIQPLVLRKIGNKFEVIAGERRYKASQLAGLQKVPAILTELDDNSSAEIAVVENIQRKELSAIEEAKSYEKLLSIGDLTQDQLAIRMGKSQPNIANKLRLLKLADEVQRALVNNEISERHARSLLQIKEPEKQIEILNRIINERLTVKQTDELIKGLSNSPREALDELSRMDDVINVNSNIEAMDINPNMQSALNDLDLKNMQSDVFNDVEPILEDKNNLEKTQILDINKIREQAQDIIKPHELPDFNTLLKTDTVETPVEQVPENIPTPPTGRFFTSLEDEITNTDINSLDNGENSQNMSMPFNNSQDIVVPNISPLNNIVSMPESSNEVQFPNIGMNISPRTPHNGTFNNAINMARSIIENMEKDGFKVDTEETDMDNVYQIVIKIDKNA